tara:strand:- start:732 stop:1247 length:516 start_codon:yes stop_codon:yes gene_type:complete
MARGGKVKKTYDLNKLSRKLASNITTGINQLGKSINKEIGVNLRKEIDIDEKPFEPLKDSTLEIKQRRGFGDNILKESGKMENRKLTQAAPTNPVLTIEMTHKGRKGVMYGGLHHTGYTTSKKSAIRGEFDVPARKWFGVPKSCRPGGPEWKKAATRTTLLNRVAWRKSGS